MCKTYKFYISELETYLYEYMQIINLIFNKHTILWKNKHILKRHKYKEKNYTLEQWNLQIIKKTCQNEYFQRIWFSIHNMN